MSETPTAVQRIKAVCARALAGDHDKRSMLAALETVIDLSGEAFDELDEFRHVMRARDCVGAQGLMEYIQQIERQSVWQFDDVDEVEAVSARVHEAWMATKQAAGVTSRRSESGEELMVPYGQLSEAAKELDRATVRAVLTAAQQETSHAR